MIASSTRPNILLITLALAAGTHTSQARDNVVMQRGGRNTNVVGDISQMTKLGVVIDVGRSPQKVPVHQIVRISYSGEPGELRSARNAILGGQLEQGIAGLEKIEKSKLSKFVRQDVDFHLAYAKAQLALRGESELMSAGRDTSAFLKRHPNSIHYYEALELMGDMAMALGRFDSAAKTYAQITQAPPKEFKMRGALLEARALRMANKIDEAQAKYQIVLDNPLNDADAQRQKKLATVGDAWCVAQAGDVDQAIDTLHRLIKDNDPKDSQLFADAYNSLGAAYQKSGKSIDATLAYLRVDVLFYNERDAHAESLYYLSKLWNELRKPDRAVQAKQTLSERYGGTVWAKRP